MRLFAAVFSVLLLLTPCICNAANPSGTQALPAFFYKSQDNAVRGRMAGFDVEFQNNRIALQGRNAILAISYPGAASGVKPQLENPTGGILNFIEGQHLSSWRSEQPLFGSVVYRSLYPGIDAHFGAGGRLLKSEYRVAPGADPTRIRILYGTAGNSQIAPDGSLAVAIPEGTLTESPPVAYQLTPQGHRNVPVAYSLNAEGEVQFQLGDYDRTAELVIDPTLAFSSYIGGNGIDAVTSTAVDSVGNVYLAGYTDSPDLPVRGALQTRGGSVDAFVVKISAAGDQLLYATYIGGSGYDQAFGIAVDSAGRAVVAGATSSVNFPILNPAQIWNAGGKDGFVLMLNSAGSGLVFSTYLGGMGSDSANAVALDTNGQIYVAGDTTSINFRTLSAYQSLNKGRQDAFAAKYTAAGAQVYSTLIGGIGDDKANAIAVDASGAAYLAGETSSPDFPAATGFQKTNGGGQDAFVAKLSPDGSALVYASYLGGTGGLAIQPEAAYGIAVDAYGNAVLTGVTSSSNFPTRSAYQAAFGGGGSDAFVAKVNSTGSALLFSTFLGGIGDDSARAIFLEPAGSVLVAGVTFSNNFPMSNAVQAIKNGQKDAFFARVSSTGTDLQFSTYLGGSGIDTANGIAATASGNIWVVGQTTSTDFPLSQPLQAFGTSEGNGFVVKIPLPAVPRHFGLPGDPEQALWAAPPYAQFLAAADFMYAKGITVGINNGTSFAAAQPITRGAMAAFLVRAWSMRVYGSVEGWRGCSSWTLAGSPSPQAFSRTPYFADTPDDSGGVYCASVDGTPNSAIAYGFFAYIQKLWELGITTGFGTVPNTYHPADNTTNLQICVFAVRARAAAEKPCMGNDTICARTFPADYSVYPASPFFIDVQPNDAIFQMAQLAQKWGALSTNKGVPGCASPIGYMCPNDPAMRAQMAGHVVRMVLGYQGY